MVLLIYQQEIRDKYVFSLYTRHLSLVPVSENELENRHQVKVFAQDIELPDPSSWPVPVESRSNMFEKLKWYLEDRMLLEEMPVDQTSFYTIKSLHDWGREIFNKLFFSENSKELYQNIYFHGPSQDSWVEIIADDPYVLTWPWEALNNEYDHLLGHRVAFERRLNSKEQKYLNAKKEMKKMELLIVSPRKTNDIDYRIISKKLLVNQSINVTILNPPTFTNLSMTLSENPEKWDVLHLDCHGDMVFKDGHFQPVLYFENEKLDLEQITGKQIIDNLTDNCPPTVIMNACRSAMATNNNNGPKDSMATYFLTLTSVESVVAMAFKLHVDTLHDFFSMFYSSLISGDRPSIAVYFGRLQIMTRNGARDMKNHDVAEWIIPVSYSKALVSVEDDLGFQRQRFIPQSNFDSKVNPHFLCREELFRNFDKLVTKTFQRFIVYGMSGIGKTELVRELIWWRQFSGDKRSVLWIDLEKIECSDDLFTNKIDGDFAEKNFLNFQNASSLFRDDFKVQGNFIVLDHLHSIDKLKDAEIVTEKILEIIEKAANSESIIIMIGRSPREVPFDNDLFVKIPMIGFNIIDTEVFVNHLSKFDFSQKEVYDFFFNIGGHPVLLVEMLKLLEKGYSMEFLSEKKVTDFMSLLSLFENTNDVERMISLFASLQDSCIKDIAPFLILSKEYATENWVCNLLDHHNKSRSHLTVKKAYDILDACGLMFDRSFFHPGLVGYLFACESFRAKISHIKIFAECWAKHMSLFSLDNEISKDFMIMMNTVRLAFDYAVENQWKHEIHVLGKSLRNFYNSRENFYETIEISHMALSVFSITSDAGYVLEEITSIIFTCRILRTANNIDQLNDIANQVLKKDSKLITSDSKAEFYYQSAKFYQEIANEQQYIDLICKSIKLLPLLKDKMIKLFIINEITLNFPTNLNESIAIEMEELLLDRSIPDNIRGNIMRMQAEKLISEKKYDEARRYLLGSNVCANKTGNKSLLAMNYSVQASLEGATSDYSKANSLFADAIHLFTTLKDFNNLAVVYHKRALVHYNIREIEQASEYWIYSAYNFKHCENYGMFEIIKNNYFYLIDIVTPQEQLILYSKWESAISTQE